jgi:hypothetical protein
VSYEWSGRYRNKENKRQIHAPSFHARIRRKKDDMIPVVIDDVVAVLLLALLLLLLLSL